MRRMRWVRTVALAVAALAGPVGMAGAQSGWTGQVTPYVWATGLGGDLTFGSRTVSFDKSFRDLLKDLDGAFFLSGFARRDRLVLLGDLSWSSSSRAGVLPPPAPGPLPAEGSLRQSSLTLAAGYRVAETAGMTVDLLGGARHWRIRTSAAVPALGFSAARRVSFTDPILAARVNAQLAPDWSALLYADIGGFGVGSHRTAQLVATVNWRASDSVWLSAGYRHLTVDYRTPDLRLDTRLSGPLLGASFRF
jgi:hypothetical protein